MRNSTNMYLFPICYLYIFRMYESIKKKVADTAIFKKYSFTDYFYAR